VLELLSMGIRGFFLSTASELSKGLFSGVEVFFDLLSPVCPNIWGGGRVEVELGEGGQGGWVGRDLVGGVRGGAGEREGMAEVFLLGVDEFVLFGQFGGEETFAFLGGFTGDRVKKGGFGKLGAGFKVLHKGAEGDGVLSPEALEVGWGVVTLEGGKGPVEGLGGLSQERRG